LLLNIQVTLRITCLVINHHHELDAPMKAMMMTSIGLDVTVLSNLSRELGQRWKIQRDGGIARVNESGEMEHEHHSPDVTAILQSLLTLTMHTSSGVLVTIPDKLNCEIKRIMLPLRWSFRM
jgi:hypothetical protein